MNIPVIASTQPVYLLKVGKSRVKILTEGARMTWWIGEGKEKRAVLYHNDGFTPHYTHPCGPIYGAISTDPTIKNNMQYFFGKDHIIPPHGFLRDIQWAFINRAETKLEGPNASIRLETENLPGKLDHEHIYIRQYPYFFRFHLAITLRSENELHYKLTFINMDNKDVPLDMASQTYFPWEEDIKISGFDEHIYHDETIWEERSYYTFKGDNFGDKMLRDWHFIGRNEHNPLTITYQDQRKIYLKPGNDFSDINPQNIVVWTNPDRGDFLCITPVLRQRNSFNSKKGILFVHPGETVSLSFTLRIEGF